MANIKNGVCFKGSDGKRVHFLSKKNDATGREFSSCDKCGFVEFKKR